MPKLTAAESTPVTELPLRVLLVEDSALLVQRIADMVGDLPDVVITAIAGTEADALARLAGGNIDVIILDLQLHGGSGFGILRELRRLPARPRVIVYTSFDIAVYREGALALGASCFLDKSRDYDRLPAVLQAMSDSRH